jgi:hypothetical protein
MPFPGFWQLGLSKGVIYWEKFSTLHEHSHFYGNWHRHGTNENRFRSEIIITSRQPMVT